MNKFQNQLSTMLSKGEINCILISGWWCSGKTHLIGLIEDSFNDDISFIEIPSIVLEDIEQNKCCIKSETSIVLRQLHYNIERLYNHNILNTYYKLLENVSHEMVTNIVQASLMTNKSTIILEVPPPFLMWWKFQTVSIWLDTHEYKRYKRIAKRIKGSISEAKIIANTQYKLIDLIISK